MKLTIREFEQQFLFVPDLIRLSMGQPGYPVDPAILEAMARSLQNPHHPYPPKNGLPELLEKLAFRENVDIEDLVITHGASEAMSAALMAVFENGGDLLLPTPSYPAYFSLCTSLKIRIRELPLCFPDFSFPPLEQISFPNVKAMVLISCGNPTGISVSPKELCRISALCRRNDWTLILDDSYAVFEKEPLPKPDCRYLQLGSFSKSHGMTEFRIGWCAGDHVLMEKIKNWIALNTVGVATCIQKGALRSMDISSAAIVAQVKENARRLIKLLEKYVPCTKEPNFYCYANVSRYSENAADFAFRLAYEAGVLVMPGDSFGKNQEQFIRICCAADRFDEALKRLEIFFAQTASGQENSSTQ